LIDFSFAESAAVRNLFCLLAPKRRISAIGGFMRRPSNFKRADLTRAVKAFQAAGQDIARVEISRDGLIAIVPSQRGGTAGPHTRVQMDNAIVSGNAVVDNDLHRELAEFNAHHESD
jgi:hypothetical protein